MDQQRAPSPLARPALSVVIACRNAADTLGTQLDALERQRCLVPWEVVVCDNGSTDGSRELALRYRTRLPRLTIVDASDVKGAGAVRNRGVEKAEGDWIAFCDADDEVANGWLQAMALALDKHRFVAGALEYQHLNGSRTTRPGGNAQESRLQWTDFGARLPHAAGANLGLHRDLFLSLGGFDPHLRWHEDTDLCWRAQLSGEALSFVPEAVVHYRTRSSLRETLLQGWQYGRAYAALEERYRAPGTFGADVFRGFAEVPVVARHRRGSSVMWKPRQAMWRVGHCLGRRAQRRDRTSPITLGPPTLDLNALGHSEQRALVHGR